MPGQDSDCERMRMSLLGGKGSHSDWEFLELMDVRTKTSG